VLHTIFETLRGPGTHDRVVEETRGGWLQSAAPQADLQSAVGARLKLLANSDSFTTITRNSQGMLGCANWSRLAWIVPLECPLPESSSWVIGRGSFEEAFERKSALLKAVVEECRAQGCAT